MKRRILSISLTLVMLLSMIPTMAFAAGTVDTGECSNGLIWTLDSDGVLTISGAGTMEDYSTIDIGDDTYVTAAPWGDYYSQITSVVIGSGVTTIGNSAFFHCNNLASITIPNGVTSIGNRVFSGCSSLASITIPDSVTTIGDYAFSYCSSLASIAIPNGVTSIGDGALSGCSSLASITIPNGVTSIGDSAFSGCSSLASITIPDSVTTIGDYVFSYCSSLASITIPNGVTSIGNRAFSGCSSLASITIPDSVTTIGGSAFTDTPWLDSQADIVIVNGILIKYQGSAADVTIPAGVTTIAGYAFSGCESLTGITIPNGVTSIGGYAFSNCSNLASITIPNGVTAIGNAAFYDCSSLESISIPDSVASIDDYAFYCCTSLASVTIGSGVTSIGKWAFTGTPWLASQGDFAIVNGILIKYQGSATDVTIPNGVTTIGDDAFSGCESLTGITIPDGVTSIGDDAFYGCSSLKSVSIGSGVTSIGAWAFYHCSSLENVTIPDGVTSIGRRTFYYCSSLKNITIPDSVTTIGDDAFYYCYDLWDIYYGGSADQWGEISIGSGNVCLTRNTVRHYVWASATSGTCGSGLTWSLNDGVLTISGTGAMDDYSACLIESFSSLDYGYAVHSTTAPWHSHYKQITSIVIGDSVTTIGDYAFRHCTSLESITIPNGVTTIGDDAFEYCTSLESVTYGGTKAQWDEISIGESNERLTRAAIRYDDPSIIASGTCGSNLTWTLDSDGALTISGSGNMYYFDMGAPSWDEYKDSITSVHLQDGVTSIGDNAFRNYTNLATVTGGKNLNYVDGYAFVGTAWLAAQGDFAILNRILLKYQGAAPKAIIPDGVVQISNGAFNGSSITSVTIPQSVTTIGRWAFEDCDALKNVQYGGTEADWLTMDIYNGNEPLEAAYFNGTRTLVDYGGFSVSGCDAMRWILDDAGNLLIGGHGVVRDYLGYEDEWDSDRAPWYGKEIKSVTLGNGITAIGDYAFDDCSEITSVHIGSGVQSISDTAFSDCSSLDTVYISNLNAWMTNAIASVLPSPYQLFVDDTLLNALDIPAGTTTIPAYAFENCTSIQSVNIPDSTTSIEGSAFAGCTNLASVTGGEGLVTVGPSAFDDTAAANSQDDFVLAGSILLSYQGEAKSVTIPEGVTVIAAYAFDNKSIQTLVIPDSVVGISWRAFRCSSIKEITIGSGVKVMEKELFYNGLITNHVDQIVFTGDAPATVENAFLDLVGTVYYPAENATWTDTVRQQFAGEITWKEHIHSFDYSADGATLTAACRNAGCTLNGKSVSLTLTAQGGSYTGQAYTVSYGEGETTAWKSATGQDAPTIEYCTEGGKSLPAAPVNAGNYLAKATVGGKTASAAFTIAKVNPTTSMKTYAVQVSSKGESGKMLNLMLPAGATAQVSSYQGIVSNASLSNGSLVYSTDQSNGGTGTVMIHVSNADNYVDYDISVTVTAERGNTSVIKSITQAISNVISSIRNFFSRLFHR